MITVDKILCPTDFSEPSYKALSIANDMAKQFSAELILIHVLSPLQVFPAATSGIPPVSPTPGESLMEMKEQAQKSLEMTIEEKVSKEVKSTSLLLEGSVAEEIAQYAQMNNISVIVMGTHGFTGWRHLMVGSVTEKVVRISLSPVLTIPAQEVGNG